MIIADSPRALRPSILGGSLLAGVAVSALVACGGQNLDGGGRHAFFVRSALAPPAHPDPSPAGCVFTADPANPALFQGRLDIGVAQTYELNLLLEGSDPTTSTSITGAHVTVTKGGTTISDVDLVTTAFISAGGDAVANVTALDPAAAAILLADLPNRTASELVITNVELKGRDPAGGSEVTSPVFSFPITVCNGCLVDFSTGNDETARIQPNCLKPSAVPLAQPCFLGQDEVVPCQLCVGAKEACDPTKLDP